MLNKLLHGFLFGLGFSVAVVLVSWGASSYYFPSNDSRITSNKKEGLSFEKKQKWRETSMSERMPELTGAVLLRFKEEEDNLMAAYVDSVYKKDNTIKIPLVIGDRVHESDYYIQEFPSSNRDGILIMYIGDPPSEIEGAYIYDDKLVAHGNMPLDIFFKKFKASN
ncbi:MAG: hypothetical protein ACI8VC_002589 [Candidatus Endobugula sp.]|jgi:hypothetical protein